jgi:hypothetical protein
MAWFLNKYVCDRCDKDWTSEWSCCCDDECAHCGARGISPKHSSDLTVVIHKQEATFIVLWSPETAEYDADYRELGHFPTRQLAEAFIVASSRLDALT